MEENKFSSVYPGQFVLSANGDYVQVPAGEPLKMHISKVETIPQKKWESEELEDKLVVRFKLDEDIEGKGQVYTGWYSPSLNPKSKLTGLVLALYNGSIPDPLDITDLLGLPVRVVLTEGKDKGDGRKRQQVQSYLKPAKDQSRVEVPVETDPVAAVADVFGA